MFNRYPLPITFGIVVTIIVVFLTEQIKIRIAKFIGDKSYALALVFCKIL